MFSNNRYLNPKLDLKIQLNGYWKYAGWKTKQLG